VCGCAHRSLENLATASPARHQRRSLHCRRRPLLPPLATPPSPPIDPPPIPFSSSEAR
jgi:hypothetical protein